MLELENLTDIKIAEFVGIKETKTLRNWKTLEEGDSPEIGKLNLYKASKLYTYLHGKKDFNSKEEKNIDILMSAADTLETNLNIDTTNLDEKIKAAIFESNLVAISNAKNILNNFTKIENMPLKIKNK